MASSKVFFMHFHRPCTLFERIVSTTPIHCLYIIQFILSKKSMSNKTYLYYKEATVHI